VVQCLRSFDCACSANRARRGVSFGAGALWSRLRRGRHVPAASQFVKRWFPIEERGKANGLIFAGVGIGAGLTPPLATAIILRYGWRAAFWFSAAIDAIASLVWYLAAAILLENTLW